MRRLIALVALTLLLLAVAARAYGSGSHAEPAQAANLTVSPQTGALGTQTVPGPTEATAVVTIRSTPIPGSLQSDRFTESVQGPATAAAIATLAPTATATQTAMPTRTVAPTATASPSTVPCTATVAPTLTPTLIPTHDLASLETPMTAPPDRIVAPAIGLDAQVIPVGWHTTTNPDGTTSLEWDVASNAAGWHQTSALPGEVGNMVIAGHSDINGEVFRNLANLKVGDEVEIEASDRAFTYTVTDKFIVADKYVSWAQRLDNAKWIGPFPDERLTLLTCWPPNNNTHRVFLIARPKR
jgi:sortase A